MARGFGPDGTNNNDVLVSTRAPAITTAITISYRAYWRGEGTSSQENVVAMVGSGGENLSLSNIDGGNRWAAFLRTYTGTLGLWYIAQPSINTWHHVAIRHDGSTSDPVIWLNGSNQTVFTSVSPVGTILTGSADSVYTLGGSASAARAIQGRLAEYALWNHEKTDADILALAGGLSPKPFVAGRLAYWDLRGGVNDQHGGVITDTGTAKITHPRIYDGMKSHGPGLSALTLTPTTRVTFGVQGISDESTTINTTIGTDFRQVTVA